MTAITFSRAAKWVICRWLSEARYSITRLLCCLGRCIPLRRNVHVPSAATCTKDTCRSTVHGRGDQWFSNGRMSYVLHLGHNAQSTCLALANCVIATIIFSSHIVPQCITVGIDRVP